MAYPNPTLRELDKKFQAILEELKPLLPSDDKADATVMKLLQYNHIVHNLVGRLEMIRTVLYHIDGDLNHNLEQIDRLEGKKD